MSAAKRTKEIISVVDELLRRITRWVDDPDGGAVVPQDVRQAIEGATATCQTGSVPACCRDLAIVGVPRLNEEFQGYDQMELGRVRLESGAPGPSFWGAVKALVSARAGYDAPAPERLEPVSVLLKQGVTHEQIARHIYGRRGTGPFIQANGAPDIGLIEKEAREPGSVIPENWVPPWVQEVAKRRQQELSDKLKAFDRLEHPRTYDDPATIEQMLRDGAFIQQIERAKGATREDVLAEAQRLGLTAVDGPGYHPGVGEFLTADTFYDDDEVEAAAERAADRQALRSLVIELYTKSNESKGAAEIATEARELGHKINANSVSAMISHWKKRRSKATKEAAS